MASAVQIANLALQKLGEDETLVSLDEGKRAARAIAVVFDAKRDEVLRAHNWNFAMKRVALPPLSDTPVWGARLAYQLPDDWLRMVEIQDEPSYEIEGRQIITDAVAPLFIRYVRQITDPNMFDALFVEALACNIAAQVAVRLTGSREKKADALAEYKEALRAARAADGQDNPPQNLPTADFLAAREANWAIPQG